MRLTKTMKEGIIERVLEEKIDVKIKEKKNQLAEVCENILIERDKKYDFESVKGFLYYTKCSVVLRNGNHYGDEIVLNLSKRYQEPTRGSEGFLYKYSEFDNVESSYAMPENMKVLYLETLELIDKKDKMKEDLRKVVMSCNTDKQLIATLPEFEKYVPTAEKAGLPLVSQDTISFVKSILE